MADAPYRCYRFEGHVLDTRSRELRDGGGVPIALTAKAYETLCQLIENRHRIVDKDELLAKVWSGRVVEENNLTQAVSALRRALGSGAGDHRFVVTVPGRGYRFVAEVQEDATDAVVADPKASRTSFPRSPGVRWNLIAPVAIGLLAILSAALAWRMHAAKPPLPPSPPMQAAVAVLPFRPLAATAPDPMLQLGLAETLITRLSSIRTMRVRSLSSSQRFTGAAQDPLLAGHQLGADYVVEGTTQRSGDRVRVSARLLSVRDGSAVWAGTFDQTIDRVFTLQDSIAAAMAAALQVKLGALPARGHSPCDGADAVAYRAYLAGRYQLDRPSAARMEDALAAFRQAIDRDPSCARAYAGMAFAYRALVMTGDHDPQRDFPLAQAAVNRALAIDPNLPEAYASQGFVRFWYDWDWAGSEASLRHAIALNPSLAEAHMAYAHLLSNLGRNDEALVQMRQAVALDPLSPLVNTLAAGFIERTGDVAGARRALDKALQVGPDFWTALLVRSGLRMQQHDVAGAIADLRRARALSGDSSQVLSVLGMLYVVAGDRPAAMQVLHDMEARDRTGYMPATSLAAVHDALGDTEGTLDLLERAYRERDVRMTFLKSDERWNNLRALPRFRVLMQRMHFAPDAPMPRTGMPHTGQKARVKDRPTVRGGP